MIPEKDKTYAIACMGPYYYNQWKGIATALGERQGLGTEGDPYIYGFKDQDGEEIRFAEEDIIAEIPDIKIPNK